MIQSPRPLDTDVHLSWSSYDTRDALTAGVVAAVRECIEDAVAAQGRATIALSGGKTPVPILERLVALPLPWSAVTIVPSDDRIVPISDALSNAGMLVRVFGRSGARVVPLVGEVAERQEAGRRADAVLHRLEWPLDLVWLGMGADGHTASIFAGADLEHALMPPPGVRAVGVRPDPLPPEAPVDRVTLTATAIAEARRCIVVLEGAKKREVLERAASEGVHSAYVIGRVLGGMSSPPAVHWVA